MSVKLTVVCENSVGRPIPACGEHGFACLVTTDEANWLFDTGGGQTLLHNLEVLDIAPESLDGVVLSHGHADHSGGLLPLLRRSGPLPVLAHEQIFLERCWQGLHERRDISCPFSRAELESAGAKLSFLDELTAIAPGLFFSGAIPRRNPLEKGDPHLLCRVGAGDWVPDSFPDDAALAVDSPRGLVILLGCAHAGLINTVEYFRRLLAPRRIHAIVGGTHLGPAGDEQFAETVAYLKQLDFDRLGVAHCTGQPRAAQLHGHFPNKLFFASVGSSLVVE